MTVREHFQARKHWLSFATIGGMTVFFAGITANAMQFKTPIWASIAIPGFGIAFISVLIASVRGFRCPRCNGNMAPIVMHATARLACCPYCTASLDDEMPRF
jgi:hypothetical protein